MKKKPDAPLRRRRRPVAAIAAAACGTALSALSLPSLADVPAMLDPNLQVTTVLSSGLTQPIGIVFLGRSTTTSCSRRPRARSSG